MDFNEMHKTEKVIEAVLNMSRLNPLEKIYAINNLSSALAAKTNFDYKIEPRSEKEISEMVDGLVDNVLGIFEKKTGECPYFEQKEDESSGNGRKPIEPLTDEDINGLLDILSSSDKKAGDEV